MRRCSRSMPRRVRWSSSSPPDHEAPTDAGVDNVYDVTVRLTDEFGAGLADQETLSITIGPAANFAPTITGLTSLLATRSTRLMRKVPRIHLTTSSRRPTPRARPPAMASSGRSSRSPMAGRRMPTTSSSMRRRAPCALPQGLISSCRPTPTATTSTRSPSRSPTTSARASPINRCSPSRSRTSTTAVAPTRRRR